MSPESAASSSTGIHPILVLAEIPAAQLNHHRLRQPVNFHPIAARCHPDFPDL